MAKISSYPSDANVTTSDRLIGSDNENSNETKNFVVGDIITLASSIILPQVAGSYVPYTGATGNVDLGSNEIYANAGYFPIIYATSIHPTIGNNSIYIGDDGLFPIGGLIIDRATNFISLGDIYSQFNNTRINIEDNSSRITFVGGFNLSNGEGTAGQVLISTGAGTTPQWATLPSFTGFVPYTGATTGVNLGIYSLTAANVNANNVVPVLGGSGNIYLGGAGGYGVAQNGVYCTQTGLVADITILGNSLPGSGTKIEIDATNTSISFLNGNVNLGGTSGLVLLNGSGSAGEVLICSGASSAPLWSNAAQLATNTFWKGSFYDTITQTLTGGANVEVPIILRSTDVTATNGVSVVTDGTNLSRITFANAGTYNILFSAQLANSGGTSQTVDFWLRKNGSTAAANIANTNGKVLLQGNANYLMAAWNYFVTVNAGDYIQLMWTATSTNITIVYEAATAVHPATPSVIVTVNLV